MLADPPPPLSPLTPPLPSLSSSPPPPPPPPRSPTDPPQCRICHDATLPLFKPCKCKGSMAFIHQDCLTHWLSIKRSSSSPNTPPPACEICHHPFLFTSEHINSAPSRPGWWDAAVGLGEAVRDVGLTIFQLISWRHLAFLFLLPLCPHLSSPLHPPSSFFSLLSLLWSLLSFIALLSILSFLFTLLTIATCHGLICLWGHELHILLHKWKKRLRAWTRGQTRERRDRGEGRDERREEAEDASIEMWMEVLLTSINVITSIESLADLFSITYTLHLALSMVGFVFPYLLTRGVAHLITLLPYSIPSLSSISYFLLRSLISILNGGLPLLLPPSFTQWLAGEQEVPAFQLPSILLHFTPATLSHLHALLHLSPVLHLICFYTFACFLLLISPVHHPMQFLLREAVGVVLKVWLMLSLEFMLIPLLMGYILHALCLPLLSSSASSSSLSFLLLSHLLASLSQPCISFPLHWIIGTSFFITSTTFFRLLIRVTRRRVISRIFSVDHRIDLIHEIHSTPLWKEIGKIGKSFTIYAALGLALVGGLSGIVYGLAAMGKLGLPIRMGSGGLLSWVIGGSVAALFVTKVLVGGKQERRERRRRQKRRMEEWIGRVAFLFGLRSYLLKDPQEKEREMEERRDRRRGMRQRRLLMAAREQDNDVLPLLEEIGLDGDIDSCDDTDDELEQWIQAAEIDHLLIEMEEDAAQPPLVGEEAEVEEVDEEEDEEEGEEERGGGLDDLLHHPFRHEFQSAVTSTIARKERDRIEKEEEKAERSSLTLFWPRLLATGITLWILALCALVPAFLLTLNVGRLVLWPIPLSFVHANDGFSLMAGYLLFCHLPSKRQLASLRLPSIRLTILKVLLLLLYFIIIFPLCVGLLTQHVLMLPFRLSLHQHPIFYLTTEWAIGVVGSLFLFAGMMAVHSMQLPARDPPPPTPLTFFSSFSLWHAHLSHLLSHPLSDTRLLSLLYDILLPPSHFFILHLALPYVVIKGLLPLRLLLPWWMRGDELLLVSYLQGGESMGLTSRLLESWIYRWAFCIGVLGRVGGWMVGWGKEWWEVYKRHAFERRWGMRRLQNVQEDEEEDVEDRREEEEQKQAGERLIDEEEKDGEDEEEDSSESDEEEEEDEDEDEDEDDGDQPPLLWHNNVEVANEIHG